jgi:CBS domain-containing protein
MMGGALGGVEAWVLPNEGAGFWPLVSMGAILGGTMRSPLTGIVFALELTHDVNMMLPLLLAVTIAHGFTVLTLRRSILTEKISRRGFHMSREYEIDPLEIIFAREAARTGVVALPAEATRDQVAAAMGGARHHHPSLGSAHEQRLFPVVDTGRRLVGVITRGGVRRWLDTPSDSAGPFADATERHPVTAYDDEPLRVIVYRMAETGLTRFPVVSRQDGALFGMIALTDLLMARTRILEAEQRRERVLGARLRLPLIFGRDRSDSAA